MLRIRPPVTVVACLSASSFAVARYVREPGRGGKVDYPRPYNISFYSVDFLVKGAYH
jgi:hypothetical protein